MSESTIPVTKNKIIEMTIDNLGHEGEGVGRYQGFTLFVPGALPQEHVRVKVVHVKKNYGYGELLEVLKESPERMVPPCPVYDQCGGCSLQHLSYIAQLRYKWQIVIDQLERIGKITDALVHPTIGMDEPWRYRNKVQVPIGEREGGLVAGFYAKGTHNIIDMNACLIQHERGDEVVATVKRIGQKLGIRPYNEVTGEGLLRHVVVKVGFSTGQLMIVLVTNGEKIPRVEEWIQEIRESIPNVTSILQNINTKRTNVILGDKTKVLWGQEVIYDTIGGLKFAISARSFFQVNPVQTEMLYNKALEYADLSGEETVIDAYCGIGTISLFLAKKAKKVYGVEIVPEAIADAKRNAKLNGIDNVEFEVGTAESILPKWKEAGIQADVIVVDPPRKGCDESLLQTIIAMQPKRVVYVSCNPSTLARDLRILEDGGYKTLEVQPVDMFPHTAHVECVVLMSRL